MKLLKLLCLIGMCLGLISQSMLSTPMYVCPQQLSNTFMMGTAHSIKILIVEVPEIKAARSVKEKFQQSVPSPLVAGAVFKLSVETSIQTSIFTASQQLREKRFDLLLIPRSFVFASGVRSFQPAFHEVILPLIRNLDEEAVDLNNAGLIDVSIRGFVVGVELPWDPGYLLAITDKTTRFKKVIHFLQAMVKNVSAFHLKEEGIKISVRTIKFENDTDEHAYDIHIEYNKAVEDADSDRETWRCDVEGSVVDCKTKDDAVAPWNPNLMMGGRLSIGVAFKGEVGELFLAK